MLEVAITTNHKGEEQYGDILVAKLSPAVWSKAEREQFIIAELDDPEVEARVSKGGVCAYPYGDMTGETVKQCVQCVDLNTLDSFRSANGIQLSRQDLVNTNGDDKDN